MTDELRRVFRSIENNEFRVTLGLAGGFQVFLEILAENPASRELLMLLSNVDKRNATLKRVAEIANRQIDLSYRNPYDITLAAYVWALWSWDTNLAEIAAGIVKEAPNTWWANLIAQQVIEKVGIRTIADMPYKEPEIIEERNDTLFTNLSWTPNATLFNYITLYPPNVSSVPSACHEMGVLILKIPSQGRFSIVKPQFDSELELWEALWQQEIFVNDKSESTEMASSRW